MEIADAQATGRFSVREDGIGFVRRYAEWLARPLDREEAGRDYAQDRTTESIMEKSRENAILAGDLLSENRKLRAALEDANGMCRSTMMIIERGGEANWAAFEERLRESLQRQHAVMHPGQNVQAMASADEKTPPKESTL